MVWVISGSTGLDEILLEAGDSFGPALVLEFLFGGIPAEIFILDTLCDILYGIVCNKYHKEECS